MQGQFPHVDISKEVVILRNVSGNWRDIHAYSLSNVILRKEADPTTDWLLGCGCWRYMTPSESNFQPISPNCRSVMVNNETVHIVHKRTSSMTLPYKRLMLDDVLHVPSLGKNLLSIGQGTKKGLIFLFDGNTCKIFGENISFESTELPLSVIQKCMENLYHSHTIKAVDLKSHQSNLFYLAWTTCSSESRHYLRQVAANPRQKN